MKLTAEETERGYVRPFRTFVQHGLCSKVSRLGRAPAQAIARKPSEVPFLYCEHCREQLPAHAFVWVDPHPGNPQYPGEVTEHVVGT